MDNIRAEQDIVSSWGNGTLNPTVSILCSTYQHQKFLRDALNGFLWQKTTFPFEIIVHDDASEDGTQEVIREYVNNYPLIFRAILQEENRYSKNEKPTSFSFAIARGKYIALCEGDDFWTSEDKLSTQIAKLEASPHASACFHSADDLNENTREFIASRWAPPFPAEEYTLNDLLEHGNFVPTASLVFRRELIENLPALLSNVPHGDFAILAKLLTCGPFLYINKSMSVYRRHSGGIHSTMWGPVANFRVLKSRINIANKLGLHDLKSYQEDLQKKLEELEKQILNDQGKIRSLETELSEVKLTYDRARRSRFFRLGILLDRAFRSSPTGPRKG